jgi:hypothetical protein
MSEERKPFLVGLITAALDAYERSEIGLARLVRDVEHAVEALFDVADATWVERLRSAWSGLEIIHALALADGRSVLTDGERADVDLTIAELRGVLAEG